MRVIAEQIARCAEVEPRLAQVRVLEHRIGVRPTRSAVRAEAARREDGTLIVHNYGHGGAGVTLSWGRAEETHRLTGRARAAEGPRGSARPT